VIGPQRPRHNIYFRGLIAVVLAAVILLPLKSLLKELRVPADI
jgi:hypothetical protein